MSVQLYNKLFYQDTALKHHFMQAWNILLQNSLWRTEDILVVWEDREQRTNHAINQTIELARRKWSELFSSGCERHIFLTTSEADTGETKLKPLKPAHCYSRLQWSYEHNVFSYLFLDQFLVQETSAKKYLPPCPNNAAFFLLFNTSYIPAFSSFEITSPESSR